ncbi:MAG: Ig-like domain-containing protein [Verrucomicrobiota bacterium]
MTATYVSGAWVPAAPTIQAGEAFVVQTAGVASRDPWVQTYSGCPPTVTVISPADGSAAVISGSVTLSAAAAADAGVARVDFIRERR